MIFNLFKSSSKLGIDIGASSVKIVELAKSGGRFVLKNYGFSELKSPAGNPLSDDPLRLPDEALTWTIKEILTKSNIKSRDAVASIPSFSTFATVIEMPYLSEDDLAKAIPFEARKYIPIPLQEVILDWSIVGIVENPSGPNVSTAMGTKAATVEVFLAAVPKDETARYQRIMKAAGLNLVALELENSGLIRALLGNDLSPTAIVNIGGRSTSIVIVAKGYERLSHNYEIGGFEITKAIARSLNISFEKAEELKRKLGLTESNENIVREAMVSLVDMMIFEAKKTITSYEESKNKKIGRVVLVGSLVNMPYFIEYFKQRIGVDTYVGNVFSRVQYPQQLEPLVQELSNNFSIAVGLAMREV
mgnify:CR=1 FL=1